MNNDMDQKKKFWGGLEIPFKKSEKEAWDAIQLRISESSYKTTKVRQLSPWKMAAAAAIALMIGSAVYFNYFSSQTMIAGTRKGEFKTVTLPDGSIATLNADATISYESNWDGNREVQLSGEAFFDVKKGERFQVITDNGTIEVLGTSFNVYSREKDLHVVCETGKVSVKSGGQEVILTPGEASFNEMGTLKKVASPAVSSWKSGVFSYDNVPLRRVIKEVERQYNVTITTDGLTDLHFTGQLGNTNLEETLNLLTAPFNLEFEKVSDGVYVVKAIP